MTNEGEVRRREPRREFDIILFGATGFTGKLVAEYLAKHPQQGELGWALAGRNRQKLEAVREDIARLAPGVSPEILVADSHDREALDGLMARTRVVCSTVGPYAQHGSDLVAAAVKAGTDYCDLTGELPWIAKMIEAHHDEATRTGARIVHCCGFDSIPSDLGTLMVQGAAKERFGRSLSEVKLIVSDR